jgi:hypothetical protein
MSTTRTVGKKGSDSKSGSNKRASAAKGSPPAQAYKNARSAIAGASTKPGLERVGRRINNSNISDADKARLRSLYKQKLKTVSSGQLGTGARAASGAAKLATKAARGSTAGKVASAVVMSGAGAAVKKAASQSAKKATKKAAKKTTKRATKKATKKATRS